jgi:hypothetical protein
VNTQVLYIGSLPRLWVVVILHLMRWWCSHCDYRDPVGEHLDGLRDGWRAQKAGYVTMSCQCFPNNGHDEHSPSLDLLNCVVPDPHLLGNGDLSS